jgi:biotin carboxyl carrier protein
MKISSRDIIEILKIARELGYHEFHLEHDGLRLTASSTARPGDATSSTGTTFSNATPGTDLSDAQARTALPDTPKPQTVVQSTAPTPSREGLFPITAPMTGIFYRSPFPGAAPFVNVGSTIKANDIVCIIEVMKLFSSIRATTDGTVEEILVENEASVVAGQVVMWLRPMES